MTTILLILQFVLTAILTVAVLLQKSSSIGLGAYSGSNESLFGAKGASGFLAKFTAIVAVIFIINCLALGYSYQKDSTKSILDSVGSKTIEIPQSQIPATPVAPQAPATK
ncbi:preprotein translocase subunit SecG [Campylobacter geochelonis]|uniref:Protein-export membrane protein SecG n=1 Tax=Campylobacter geochelonis TaxID=1780362 RepID=A0A128EE14_9BACT|nr:preprotein translocase subunit SecG [Campylobacter geochelonis]QKF70365.1 preprotein translocase SecYEG, SecG subunit [Campylobacter geochelonis]CZE46197.1 AraC family transcriptional regulator [Campylobacter geochelonis]CZE46433.1 AraC family transcriptional regulator [Campylobacter geochelonis]CZE50751.1 AraC family transcriptional regulator [Campylobacter geochelonis]